jgi:Gpi18-like mannosyltransferase
VLLAAGWLPLCAVVAAGITIGFFGWFGLLLSANKPALSEIGLLAALAGAPALVVWAWIAYSEYFARRTGVKLQRSMQYDALTWVPFLLLWLTFVLPMTLTHGARLVLVAVAIFAIGKLAIAARFNQTVRDVLVDFIVTRFAIIVIAELAAVIIGQRAGTHVQESRHLLLAVWGRWDAVHYLDIATQGYHGTDMAFFPLFPLLVSLLGAFAGNHLVAGLIVSNVAFFFGLLYLYKLVEHEYDRHVARRAIFYISIFPTSIFFSAVYTESLFFMLTVASFYYMRERKWWLAGAIGFFASMTRVEGVLLTVPFLIEWFTAYRGAIVSGIKNLVAIALIPLGLLVYMGYLWVLNGDPLYFSHVQVHWHRELAMPWTSVINAFHKIASATTPQTVANQGLELVFTALMVAVLVAGFRRLRPSYIAYMALSILVPMSTSSLMSMPRFALVLFPMFVIFALWGRRPAINNAIVAFSLPLLGLFTVLFADWYWVA